MFSWICRSSPIIPLLLLSAQDYGGSRLPAGLKEQIDDLDMLLDQLLKLPIDRVQAAPATLPLKPKSVAVATPARVELEPETSILRFGGMEEEKKPMLALADDSEMEGDEEDLALADHHDIAAEMTQEESKVSEEVGLSVGSSESHSDTSGHRPLTPSPSPRKGEGSQTSLPVEEIPWIDDEPLPGGRSKGPLIEIIQGPTSNIVVAPLGENARPSAPVEARRGWVFWIFWTITWCFDNTLGHWFPWLRRPNVKFLLGLVGVALFAVSIYLVWIGWLR